MTLPQEIAGRNTRLRLFWVTLESRLSTTEILNILNGGEVYRATDDFSQDERTDAQPWGRLIIIPSTTLWPSSDVSGGYRDFNFSIRAEMRVPDPTHNDPLQPLEGLQSRVFELLEGWLPTPAQVGVVLRQAVTRYSPTEAMPDWDAERSMWLLTSEWRCRASRP